MNILASKAQLRASFLRWALFLVPLIVLLGFVAGQAGGPDTAWFQSLNKPAIFPPPATFGIVWSIIYVLIGFSLALVVSAWGAYGRRFAIIVFALHFIGNLAWTPVFFGMQNMTAALYVMGYLVVTLLGVMVLFWRVRKLAAVLLVPYLAWGIFAAVLNYQFIAENPDGGDPTETGVVERVTL
ncbi:tryptophan-rich sensory protein [Erythrobacter insulae]|uniref:Tryptophan-rich sensory protein n=1 Tax=Erythrobacter insulae TaxID=2584124 RepID=A0A547PDS6_9SPHN|nr:TspO/MBR family protein [Erythrobacter insulae]TRD12293.1 tryptophan-rich sensory protein [Erythrobacter insulae]